MGKRKPRSKGTKRRIVLRNLHDEKWPSPNGKGMEHSLRKYSASKPHVGASANSLALREMNNRVSSLARGTPVPPTKGIHPPRIEMVQNKTYQAKVKDEPKLRHVYLVEQEKYKIAVVWLNNSTKCILFEINRHVAVMRKSIAYPDRMRATRAWLEDRVTWISKSPLKE